MTVYCPSISVRVGICCMVYSYQCEVLASYDRSPVVAEAEMAVALHVCPRCHDPGACERCHYAFSDPWVEDEGSQALFAVTTPHPRDHHCPCLQALNPPPVARPSWLHHSAVPRAELARSSLRAELEPVAGESCRTGRAGQCRLVARE